MGYRSLGPALPRRRAAQCHALQPLSLLSPGTWALKAGTRDRAFRASYQPAYDDRSRWPPCSGAVAQVSDGPGPGSWCCPGGQLVRDALAAFPADEPQAPNAFQGLTLPVPSPASSSDTLHRTGTLPTGPSLHDTLHPPVHPLNQHVLFEHPWGCSHCVWAGDRG